MSEQISNLNMQWWPYIERYSKAYKNGYNIEALVCSIYMFRYLLLNILDNHLAKENKPFKKGYLTQDVNKLAETCSSLKVVSDEHWKKIDKYYKKRNEVIHGMINGEIDYDQIKKEVNDAMKLYTDLQTCYFFVVCPGIPVNGIKS